MPSIGLLPSILDCTPPIAASYNANVGALPAAPINALSIFVKLGIKFSGNDSPVFNALSTVFLPNFLYALFFTSFCPKLPATALPATVPTFIVIISRGIMKDMRLAPISSRTVKSVSSTL